MRVWFHNVLMAIKTVAQGMYITLWYFLQTYRRKTFTERFEYPELPVPVKPRYRGFHRFDLTTCIGCDKCARACPVDCIYIEKIKNPVGKGFRVNGFTIDYTKCMFCALCVDPCPVDCIFMGSTHDQSCFSRDGCIVDFAKLPVEVAWGQATLNPSAVAASKLQVGPVWTKPPDPRRRRRNNTMANGRRQPAGTGQTSRLTPAVRQRERGGTEMVAPKTSKKYFTVAEANSMLPLVRVIVGDISELAGQLRERYERLNRLRPGDRSRLSDAHDEELQQAQAEFERGQAKMEEYERELKKLGIELKDYFTGLIDFPSVRNGRVVYLCWRLGESEVAYWHELEAGFAGRQKLVADTSRV